jgi:hypothetical protein
MTRPPRDVDLLFRLPASEKRDTQWNRNVQSEILQNVKNVLARAYPATLIKGNGPVVEVYFSATNVEVVPAFARYDDKYDICITTDGGSYKEFAPKSEIAHISYHDTQYDGKVRDLVRMMKTWQSVCNVPLKSFYIELLAVEFLKGWQYNDKTRSWYDWMVRDYLIHLKDARSVMVPGTFEFISIGDSHVSRTETALGRARKAIEYEGKYNALAVGEWQKIFGTDFKG